MTLIYDITPEGDLKFSRPEGLIRLPFQSFKHLMLVSPPAGLHLIEPEWLDLKTDSPIITDDIEEDTKLFGRVWWYDLPANKLVDPLTRLSLEGSVVFRSFLNAN